MPEPFEHPDALIQGEARGRGAGLNPGNRFQTVRLHVLGEFMDDQARDAEPGDETKRHHHPTTVYRDETKSLITHNDSPDVPFTWSINPYRGCEHGCIYCYMLSKRSHRWKQ